MIGWFLRHFWPIGGSVPGKMDRFVLIAERLTPRTVGWYSGPVPELPGVSYYVACTTTSQDEWYVRIGPTSWSTPPGPPAWALNGETFRTRKDVLEAIVTALRAADEDLAQKDPVRLAATRFTERS